MTILENYSLKDHNTFRVDAKAKYFIEAKNNDELLEILKDKKFENEKIYLLGGGSNILILNDLDGLVIKISSEGIDRVFEDDDKVIIKIEAGHNWHKLVEYTVMHGWYGIENLALIPGTVGAAAVQNIAAYGENFEDQFIKLTAINRETLEVQEFSKAECEFSYRSSKFKGKNEWIVIDVTLELSKNGSIETSYHERYLSLEGELKLFAKEPYSLLDIFNAVINLRNKKLPKVEEWGTCGSFFVNPHVSVKKFKELSNQMTELQRYPIEGLNYDIKDWDDVSTLSDEMMVKIPAARLLDELGWKGKWIGNVGTFDKHALCVITNWKASGQEVLDFVNQMKKSVLDAYGVELQSEIIVMK